MFQNKLLNITLTKTKFTLGVLFFILLCGMYINSSISFRLKLADYYLRNESYVKTIKTYRKILRKETFSAKYKISESNRISDIRFALAKLFLIKNRFVAAAETIKQIIKFNPFYKIISFPPLPNPEAYKRFGISLSQLGLKDIAVKQFEKVVELEPDNFLGYYQLALIYKKQGNKDEAITQFKNVIELFNKKQPANKSPGYLGDSYYNLALNLEKDGNIEKAKNYYKKAIKLDGNRIIEGYYRLKSLYQRENNFEDSKSLDAKFLNLKPEYEVNHKFSNGLILLGYSLNEKEFELFNEGEITFFWELPKQGTKFIDVKNKAENIYGVNNRIYKIDKIKNLTKNFGFELDCLGIGFPYGWDTDVYADNPVYYTPIECHEIISEKETLGKTQRLLLNNKLSMFTSCQSDLIPVNKNNFYLEAGWLKSINGRVYFGRRWFDREENAMEYNYVVKDIRLPEWRYYFQIITPPNSSYCRLWVMNCETHGKAYFDDILFIKLQLPELSKNKEI